MAYDHREIEKKAQEKWAELDLYKTDLSDKSKEPYYLLVEFPYPSGDLHIGHWYAFAITDIYARLMRARGKNVLFPIGFDAFGLPAENAAIKNGLNPKEWTYKNIEHMRSQLKTMGASFDWSKEVVTCEPEYYQWTQWLFTKLFEHKLAVRRSAPVKWCPKDKTVLANEQIVDGCCERCGTEVEEKRLTQWFLKITEYAERLIEGLEKLPWRKEIKDAQRAWIGKSEGAKLKFNISTTSSANGTLESIEVFTTRPDTIFGVTYVVLAPEHPLVSVITDKTNSFITNTDAVQEYIKTTEKKTERDRSENKEKTGIRLEGIMAINPATKKEIPIYIADYVLASYGTGAVMAVPAHDERDYAFAQKFGLPILKVIGAKDSSGADVSTENICWTKDGILINSEMFTGMKSDEVKWDITKYVGGERTTQYRIRDWLVSRQRYWGCPIPIVYSPEGTPHAVPSEHLPWILPTGVDSKPNGESPLSSSKELKERVVRIFGEGWTPEYDTLDTFVDSSWYFLRYLSPKNIHNFSDTELMKSWLPINRYSGGSEHTTMHLLYARFFMKALYDLSLVPEDEPFEERFNRGLIMGPDGQKMSKSKGNVINPDDFVKEYGADAVRMYLAFVGPYNEPGNYPWNLEGVASMRKFLERIVRIVERVNDDKKQPKNIEQALARASAKISLDSDRFKFNTSISALMILVNEFEACEEGVSKMSAKELVIMLAPFAPHITEYLWEELGNKESVHQQSWTDLTLEENTTKEVAVQINGKRRGVITLKVGASEEDALAIASALPNVAKALIGTKTKRVIYVPGKIINLVV